MVFVKALFKYERKEYQKYLEDITVNGRYQDYENAIYRMNENKNKLRERGFEVYSLIDQIDNTYYGDIMFAMPKNISEQALCVESDKIIETLITMGIIDTETDRNCIYFNEKMWGFMYTAVVVNANDGPNLYLQGRKFIVR